MDAREKRDSAAKRADAERNRERIVAAAQEAFADPGADVSMAEVARRAGVGSATLYRNFASRRELLEALYVGEVDALVEAGETIEKGSPGANFTAWLRRFFAYYVSKRPVASELFDSDPGNPVFGAGRARVMAVGKSLLGAAQDEGEVRRDLSFAQIIDLVVAVAKIEGDADHVEPILEAALGAIRPR